MSEPKPDPKPRNARKVKPIMLERLATSGGTEQWDVVHHSGFESTDAAIAHAKTLTPGTFRVILVATKFKTETVQIPKTSVHIL